MNRPMNRSVTSRYPVLIGLTALTIVAAVLGRQPLLAVAALPFAALVLIATALHRWPEIEVSVRLSAPRCVEGDTVEVIVELRSDVSVAWVDLWFELPAAMTASRGTNRVIVALKANEVRQVRLAVDVSRWGLWSPERLWIIARDGFGLFVSSRIERVDAPLRAYPGQSTVAAVIEPAQLRRSLGTHLSNRRGEGCEFADARPFRSGDNLKSVHWRISARRGEWWVSERHPERSADVLLLLDATQDVGALADSTLRRAVRAASALLEGHVGVHDRVGLYTLGGLVRWIPLGGGPGHTSRVVDALLDAQAAARRPPQPIDLAPLRSLGHGSAVVALTSLLDDRLPGVLVDLRRRGLDVLAIYVDPTDALPPTVDLSAAAARQLWQLEAAALQRRLVNAGVKTLRWDGTAPLGPLLAVARRRLASVSPR